MHPDRELVGRAARGDEAAFRSIWERLHDPVYHFACWMLQDAAAAEDVAQESFLALLEHPDRFAPTRGSLRAFLIAIARNQCRLRWRKTALETPFDDEPMTGEAPDPMVTAESQAILQAAVAKLPPLQREALYLFEYEELTLEQAASAAGTDTGTLKSRLHRARQRLRRELAWLVKEGF